MLISLEWFHAAVPTPFVAKLCKPTVGLRTWRKIIVAFAAGAANEDARGFAALAPFGRPCDQLAVAVAFDNVGDRERRQAALWVEGLAATLDGAVGLEGLRSAV